MISRQSLRGRLPLAFTIQGDKLAAEAVHTFEQHLIDEVVVINAENQVIGLIDVQDLSRTQIF